MINIPPAEYPNMNRRNVDGFTNQRCGVEILQDDPQTLPHLRVYSHSVAVSPPGEVELRSTQVTTDRSGLAVRPLLVVLEFWMVWQTPVCPIHELKRCDAAP